MIVVTHTTVRKAPSSVKPSGYKGSVLAPVTIYIMLGSLRDTWSNRIQWGRGTIANKQSHELSKRRITTSKKKGAEQITPLVVTYHPDLPHLSRILRNHQESLIYPLD